MKVRLAAKLAEEDPGLRKRMFTFRGWSYFFMVYLIKFMLTTVLVFSYDAASRRMVKV
jgi:hypothetical protein